MDKHQNKVAFASACRKATMIRVLLLGLCVAAGWLSSSAMVAMAGDEDGDDGPVVRTANGPVRGFERNEVFEFLGIPYAAPPVGALRWMPPQPVKRWFEPLRATKFGNTCPQSYELATFAGPTSTTEDCLYLNVFTTGVGGAKKPVFVWIHGGGDFDGESNDYDATKLATGGPLGTPTVVVTINYRLGLLGFLSESHLNAEGHPWGNYGILDQQAALRWVQANIEAFGGDPTRVALGGQSGGAVDTSANLVSPSATGLFNRAIMESAIVGTFASTAAAALSRGNAFATAAACSDAACLRSLSVARILQLQGTLKANGPYLDPSAETVFVDGTIVPVQPMAAWATGNFNKMPVMGGDVIDESLFSQAIIEYFTGYPFMAMTPQQYVDAVTATYGANAHKVLAEYPLSNYGGNPTLAYDRVGSDPIECSANLSAAKVLAAAVPLYAYDFTYQHPPVYMPQMPNPYDPTGYFQALAYHTSDIQFLFIGYHGGQLGVNLDQISGQPRDLVASESYLSDQLVGYWTNFVSTGNPNAHGNPVWPVFSPASSVHLREDIPVSTETEAQFRAKYKCHFWDSL
jgi:para-nitrobenzyl esterase